MDNPSDGIYSLIFEIHEGRASSFEEARALCNRESGFIFHLPPFEFPLKYRGKRAADRKRW